MIDRVYSRLLFLVIFLIPFTGLKGGAFLGEISGEGHIYPMLLCTLLGLVYFNSNLPKINVAVLYILSIFFFVLFISFLSIHSIYEQEYFKNTNGIRRLITQSFVLLIYTLFSCSVYFHLISVGKRKVMGTLFNASRASFLLVIAFSLIEAPYVLGSDVTKPLLDMYSKAIRADEYFDYLRRMRSVAYEAPSLAMFLPLPLIMIFTSKNSNRAKKITTLFIIVILIILTFSRTALVVVMILLLLYLYLKMIKLNIGSKVLAYTTHFLILIFLFCIDALLNLGVIDSLVTKVSSLAIDTADDYHLASNLGRWGAQVAALNIGFDNLILGVGLGQSGFYLPYYYPDWAFGSFQVRNWADPSDPLWPPVFSLYTRIFSELGIVAISTVIVFTFYTLKKLRKAFIKSSNHTYELFLIMSFVYCVLIFAQFASFRFVYFWVILPIIINYFETINEKN